MLSNIRPKETEELYATPILQQTAFWSVVKQRLGAHTIAINFSSNKSALYGLTHERSTIISDVLIVLQQIDRHHSVAYVPYGPELEPADEFQGMFLEELSESLRSFLPKECILIRYDLCWESYWAKGSDYFDESGIWKGEPDSQAQEFRFNFNTHHWNFKKAYTNILPSNTVYLDLTLDSDTLLKRMKHSNFKNEYSNRLTSLTVLFDRGYEIGTIIKRMKHQARNNIGMMRRKGVIVSSMGMEGMESWYALYRETAVRNQILLNEMN